MSTVVLQRFKNQTTILDESTKVVMKIVKVPFLHFKFAELWCSRNGLRVVQIVDSKDW